MSLPMRVTTSCMSNNTNRSTKSRMSNNLKTVKRIKQIYTFMNVKKYKICKDNKNYCRPPKKPLLV